MAGGVVIYMLLGALLFMYLEAGATQHGAESKLTRGIVLSVERRNCVLTAINDTHVCCFNKNKSFVF